MLQKLVLNIKLNSSDLVFVLICGFEGSIISCKYSINFSFSTMCILDIFRLHVSHNYTKRKYAKSSRSECTDMSMINWSKKKTSSAQQRSKKMLQQLSELDDDHNLPSISESICCSDYIINGGFCSKDHLCEEEDKWVPFTHFFVQKYKLRTKYICMYAHWCKMCLTILSEFINTI